MGDKNKRTLADLVREDGFSVYGTASGRTTPNIGDSAYDFGYSDPMGAGSMGMQFMQPRFQPSMGGIEQPSMSAAGLTGAAEPLFKANTGFGGDETGGGGEGMSGWEKAALAANIASALGGIYGQYKEGRARDEEIERRRAEEDRKLRERNESARRLSPILAGLLGKNRR